MAGDWIKMRADLQTHPKVVRIMSALKADRLRVIGGLHAVWCLFDAHSVDGTLEGYTSEALDNVIGWTGFSAAMISVGWLEEDGESLSTPRFDEHNGQSAKRRAQETERKRAARSEDKTSADDADKKRTREEKRREYKKPSSDESDMPAGFSKFWAAWPNSARKVAKAECLKRWKAKGLEHIADAVVSHVLACKQSKQWQDGYDPAPLTYLNQRRWLDGEQPALAVVPDPRFKGAK